MPLIIFTMPIELRVHPPLVDEKDFSGEDVSMLGGELGETPGGDWAVVRDRDAARQSIIRELPSPPGSLPSRPEWGGGLNALVMKPASQANRDLARSQSQARLDANPRILKTNEVSVAKFAGGGIVVTVRADAKGGPIEAQTLIKPPGV